MRDQINMGEAYERWSRDPDDLNTSTYLKSIKPVLGGALKSYAPGMEKDLGTHAKIMALNISRKYDPSRGTKLQTYLMQNLRSLGREYKKRLNPVKIPEKLVLDRNKINMAATDFEVKRGREPSTQELADLTSLSIRRIESARASDKIAPSAIMTSEEGDLPGVAGKTRLWADYVYHDLDPVDQKIFEWSTGYGGVKTLKKGDIAEKLKISAPAVSARIRKIMKKIEEGMVLDG